MNHFYSGIDKSVYLVMLVYQVYLWYIINWIGQNLCFN